MKKCNTCGAVVADDSRFCCECGSSDIAPLPDEAPVRAPVNEPTSAAPPAAQAAPYGQPSPPAPQPNGTAGGYPPAAPANNGGQSFYSQAQTPSGAAPSGGYYGSGSIPPAGAPYPQQNAYPYASGQPDYTPAQPAKKQKKTGMIIAIVLGVLFILGAIVLAIGARIVKKEMEEFDPEGYIDEIIGEFEDGLTEDAAPAVPYTKGALEGDVYTNEWAGLRFTIPEGFVNGSAADYEDNSDDRTEAGFVTSSDNEDGEFLLLFEDVSDISGGVTETQYLDIVTENWVTEEDEENGWKLSDYYTVTIAGEIYRAARMSNDLTEYVQVMACRSFDDHMLCFLCWATADEVDDFFNGITAP